MIYHVIDIEEDYDLEISLMDYTLDDVTVQTLHDLTAPMEYSNWYKVMVF